MFVEQTEEEKKKQQLDPSQVNSTAVGAGGGAELQPSTAPALPNASRLTSTAQTTPQNFGTIQDYFKGNQQQGEKFGQQFTTKLADTQEQQRGAIGQAAQQARGDIGASRVNFDEGLISKAVSDPTKVAGNEGDFDAFLKQWNAAYRGPESFEGSAQYEAAAKAAQAANEKAVQAETTGGRQQLIQDEFGVYGQGNKGLDEALLQQSSSFPKVQEQAKGFRSIQDYLGQQAKDVNIQAQQAKEATQQARQQTQGAFQGALTKFQKDLNERVAATKAPLTERQKGLQQSLVQGDPGTSLYNLQEAGVAPEQAQTIAEYLRSLNQGYRAVPSNLGNYIANPAANVTPANVATPEDYAKAAALQKLTGVDYGGILNPADIGQAGTASKDAVDASGLSSYLKSTLSKRDSEVLRSPDLKSAFNVMGSRNILDVNLAGNPGTGSRAAQTLIDAAKRSGDFEANKAKLLEYRQEAENAYNHHRNYNKFATGPQDRPPALAGLETFIRTLSGVVGGESGLGAPPETPPPPPVTSDRGVMRAF